MKSAVLPLVLAGLVTAACYDSPAGVRLTTGSSSLTPVGIFAPNPIALTPLSVGCARGAAFGTSFNLVLSAGAHDVTLDSVTLHLIDGTNLGGPSVTIPSLDLSSQFGSTFIRAGTTRAFALHPTFGCLPFQPRLLRGNALVLDGQGMTQTLLLESAIH